ncbi:hypothetical protein BH11BAC4_BH11BAC4_00110 [soil metagenome]
MKKLFSIPVIVLCFFWVSCKERTNNNIQKISADKKMLDSIKLKADTTFSKRYPGVVFTKAEYFVNDSNTTQVMKDSNGVIRQIIIEQNKRRIYYARFYENGQLMAKVNLDNFGQYDGISNEYYENGNLKATGVYRKGFRFGKWTNYTEDGRYVSTDEYNKDGQKIN